MKLRYCHSCGETLLGEACVQNPINDDFRFYLTPECKEAAMNTASEIAGRIYPAKSARLGLIDLLKEQMHASYQPVDRASITRPVLDRVIADLEHAVQLLDALQDERDKNAAAEFRRREDAAPSPS